MDPQHQIRIHGGHGRGPAARHLLQAPGYPGPPRACRIPP
jgi:hypothetical protein